MLPSTNILGCFGILSEPDPGNIMGFDKSAITFKWLFINGYKNHTFKTTKSTQIAWSLSIQEIWTQGSINSVTSLWVSSVWKWFFFCIIYDTLSIIPYLFVVNMRNILLLPTFVFLYVILVVTISSLNHCIVCTTHGVCNLLLLF